MMFKPPALTDVPVFLMIFVRPDELRLSFEAIKKARPSKLFIVSDGPRTSHPNDKNLNDICKQIVSDIDWECQVFHKYSEVNQGMFVTAYEGFKWAFEKVDRFVFLEDDVVPSQSFFKFCEILLEKYKDDLRIHTICGMNHSETHDEVTADYFFSKVGSIWGFAIWKRTFETFEYDLAFNEDAYFKKLLINSYPKSFQKGIKEAIESKRKLFLEKNIMGDFELVNGASFFLQNGLMIIPTKNLISCHGISENASHNVNNPKKTPKSIRRLFNMKTYDIEFPLKHPKYIIADPFYEKQVYKIMGNSSFIRFTRRFESIIRQFVYGNSSERKKMLLKIFK